MICIHSAIPIDKNCHESSKQSPSAANTAGSHSWSCNHEGKFGTISQLAKNGFAALRMPTCYLAIKKPHPADTAQPAKPSMRVKPLFLITTISADNTIPYMAVR